MIKSNPLSSVIFDGRTLHKGLENNTKETRYAIYISYHTPSYIDKESILEHVLHKGLFDPFLTSIGIVKALILCILKLIIC
jgi:hypothetical protein